MQAAKSARDEIEERVLASAKSAPPTGVGEAAQGWDGMVVFSQFNNYSGGK